MSACLQLDVGNSGAKWRLVTPEGVADRGRFPLGEGREQLPEITGELEQIWIASVAAPTLEEELAASCTARWGVRPWFARTQASTADLTNSYEEPGRMGVDRWLAMLGARRRQPGRVCVVDAGSALTVDLVSASGVHEGGYIIPGADLMERALLLDTDRVRFEEAAEYSLNPGVSTADAVRHGIAIAQVGAVATALDQTSGDSPSLLFCGGGGQQLMNLLERGGVWAPDLVFEGLEVMAALR